MRLPVHVSSGQSDWESVPPSKRNFWQRTAFKTNGILTPANVISIFGVIAVMTGLVMVIDKEYSGVVLILLGRMADVADGFVADITGTKSPLGEALDASADKFLLLFAVVVLGLSELAPYWILAILVFHGSFNTVISLLSKWKKVAVHPVKSGKLSTAAAWLSIAAFAAGWSVNAFDIAGMILFGIYLYLGVISSADYYRQLKAGYGKK